MSLGGTSYDYLKNIKMIRSLSLCHYIGLYAAWQCNFSFCNKVLTRHHNVPRINATVIQLLVLEHFLHGEYRYQTVFNIRNTDLALVDGF